MHLTAEQLEVLKDARVKCENEHNTPPEMIEKARHGELTNDEGLKKFLFCFLKKIMFMKEDGSFNLSQMESSLTSVLDNGKQVFDTCSANVDPSPTETAFKFAQCFHDHVTDHSFEEQY